MKPHTLWVGVIAATWATTAPAMALEKSETETENVDETDDALVTQSKAECIAACKAGGARMEAFCRSLPDPRFRAGCWGVVLGTTVACINWCHWNF